MPRLPAFKWLQLAAGMLFLLSVAAANLLTPASPIWLAGSILIIICALAGALIPAAISLLQTKEIARGWVVTTISFCLLFAVGSLNLLPVDSDLGAFDVFAIINGDSTTKQSSIAQAAQNALELPDRAQRIAAARAVYMLTGKQVNFRDQRDEVVKFNPEPDDRNRTGTMLASEQVVNHALDVRARGRFARETVKLLGFLALVASMCIATLMCSQRATQPT